MFVNFLNQLSPSPTVAEIPVPPKTEPKPKPETVRIPMELALRLKSKEHAYIKIWVTPEIAQYLLDTTNLKNPRPIRDQHVNKLAIDMSQGRWEFNSVPIVIGSDGILLDGQHRLTACVLSGCAFETVIALGINPSASVTYDTNMVRSTGTIAHTQGILNSHACCAVANLLLIHENWGIQGMNNDNRQPSKTQIIARAAADKKLQLIASHCQAWGAGLVHPRIINFTYYLFSNQEPHLADRFFEEFRNGANIADDNPVFQLRKRLFTNKISKAKIRPLEIIALFFKAWNAYKKDRPVRELRWRSRGDSPEPFPNIG
jgi:hypothetical protein